MKYLDFDLQIEAKGEGNQYRARVLDSPAGQAESFFVLPFDEKDLQIFVLSVGRTRLGVRALNSPQMRKATEFGSQLYRAVFQDQVQACLLRSLDEAEKQDVGLRLRLRLDGSLINLPWEYLYDTVHRRFLSHSTRTPIVRFIELSQRIPALPVTPPLKVLVMIASPSDYIPLDVEQEWNKVKAALKQLEEQGLIQLTRLESGTLSALRRKLLKEQFHIFHYIGHGAYEPENEEGVLLLEDDNGRGRRVSGSHLGTLLHDHRSLRLVLLNACEGARTAVTDLFAGVAQHLVLQGLPAVIAMQFEITDQAAITLAQAFYEALVTGASVDESLAEARKAIFSEGNDVEWGTPVLYMRATDGRLFEVDATAPSKVVKEMSVLRAAEGGGKDKRESEKPAAKPTTDYDAVIAQLKAQLEEQNRRFSEAQTPKAETAPATVSPTRHSLPAPRPKIDFDWVTIPSGEFLMGSDKAKDKDAYADELPQHKLYLPEYKIARVPVTVAQFAQFVTATNYKTLAEQKGMAWDWAEKDKKWQWVEIKGAYWGAPRGVGSDVRNKQNHPVTCVSWHDAMKFCEWADVRLPNEAEWEKAARGISGRIYPWGNEAPDQSRCNFNMNVGDTTPVGNYPKGATPEGLQDLAGNVQEWTTSLWGKDANKPDFGYPYKAGDGRENLSAGDDVIRVVRGGAFFYYPRLVRCAVRYSFSPNNRVSGLGLRVVLSPGS